MAIKKITMHRKTATGYDDIYPKTEVSQVDGLQTELDSKQDLIDSTNKLSADLVNDASTTNKFVTASEKTKISTAIQPNERISVLDNDAGYITDTAIVGKENISNKVTSISSTATDIQYPSAKVVYDNLTLKQNKIFVQETQPSSFTIGDIWYDIVGTYNITPTLTHCTGSASNPTTIKEGQTATLTFTANEHYNLPSTVTVTGATSAWDQSTGVLTLSNPINNITFTISAEPDVFTITNVLTNCTKTSGATTINYGSSETLVFSANPGYGLPTSIVVTGATSNWTKETGTLVLSNPTDNVGVTIAAETQTFTITNSLTNCSKISGPDTIITDTTATLTFMADEDYLLPFSIDVIGAAYTWTQSTGVLTLSNPVSNVSINIVAITPLAMPLTLTANTAGSTVTLGKNGSPTWAGSYSTDCINWTTYTPGTTGAITLANVGDKVYFRGNITSDFSNYNYLRFTMTGSISASGNVNSMYISNNFESLTALTYAFCYCKLFSDCTSLITPPILPATTLSVACYHTMFARSGITLAPVLPATTLIEACYKNMFNGCSSLAVAPVLSADVLTSYCYNNMFAGCSLLTVPPVLSATTLANGCYMGMFNGCTSLTTVPKLSATTLASSCYASMFSDCRALQVSDTQTAQATHAWTLPTTGTFTNTYSQAFMFAYCAGTHASEDMPGEAGQSYTYYTQNEPV